MMRSCIQYPVPRIERLTATTETVGRGFLGPVASFGVLMGLGTWLGFAFGVLAPFLVTELGWSDLQAGSLTSVMYASGALLAPLAGRIVDSLGTRRTALMMPVVVAIAHGLVSVAGGFVVATVGAAVGGLALAASNPTTNRLVVETIPLPRRGAAIGWKQAGVSVAGFATGAALPGIASAVGWRPAMALGGAFGLAALPLLVRALPRTRSEVVEDAVAAPVGHGARRIPAYAAVMGAMNGALVAYLALYAVRELELPPGIGGAALAIMGLLAAGARVGWAAAGGRLGRHVELLRVVSLLAASGALLLAVTPHRGAASLLTAGALLGATTMSWHALAMLAAVADVPVERVGRVTGTVMQAFYGGYVVGPLAFGLLVQSGGSYRAGWWAVCALALTAALLPRARSHGDDRPSGPGIDGRDPR